MAMQYPEREETLSYGDAKSLRRRNPKLWRRTTLSYGGEEPTLRYGDDIPCGMAMIYPKLWRRTTLRYGGEEHALRYGDDIP